MALSGKQFYKIQQALLDAYRSESGLAIMVRIVLDENLSTITQGSNLNDVVFELINWADATGRLQELIDGAHEHNPGNPKVKSLVQHEDSQPDDSESPALTQPSQPQEVLPSVSKINNSNVTIGYISGGINASTIAGGNVHKSSKS